MATWRQSRHWVLLVLTLLAPAAARGDAPPLLVRAELKESDPLDRVQKASPARIHEVELQAGQAIVACRTP